jgi:hypothetical protein
MAALLLGLAGGGVASAQALSELMASAKPVGEVLVIANDYVRVRYAVLEYPTAERREAESRPVVVYIAVEPQPGVLNTEALLPPRGARSPWGHGIMPRAIRIEVLKPPPAPPALGDPGTELPRDATDEARWEGGRLILATFEPLHFAEGAGRFPSVTTFLSDGVVDVSAHGVRRRMGVRAGDAFWFDAATRLTVVSDYPVGAAIVQLYPRR